MIRVSALVLYLSLAGCGLKGDLYLPEEPEQAPAEETSPAAGDAGEAAAADEDDAL